MATFPTRIALSNYDSGTDETDNDSTVESEFTDLHGDSDVSDSDVDDSQDTLENDGTAFHTGDGEGDPEHNLHRERRGIEFPLDTRIEIPAKPTCVVLRSATHELYVADSRNHLSRIDLESGASCTLDNDTSVPIKHMQFWEDKLITLGGTQSQWKSNWPRCTLYDLSELPPSHAPRNEGTTPQPPKEVVYSTQCTPVFLLIWRRFAILGLRPLTLGTTTAGLQRYSQLVAVDLHTRKTVLHKKCLGRPGAVLAAADIEYHRNMLLLCGTSSRAITGYDLTDSIFNCKPVFQVPLEYEQGNRKKKKVTFSGVRCIKIIRGSNNHHGTVVVCNKTCMYILDVSTKRWQHKIPFGVGEGLVGLWVTPQHAFVALPYGVVHVYSTATGTLMQRIRHTQNSKQDSLSCATLNKNQYMLVTGGVDAHLTVTDLYSMKEHRSVHLDGKDVWSSSVAALDNYVVFSSTSHLVVADIENQTIVLSIPVQRKAEREQFGVLVAPTNSNSNSNNNSTLRRVFIKSKIEGSRRTACRCIEIDTHAMAVSGQCTVVSGMIGAGTMVGNHLAINVYSKSSSYVYVFSSDSDMSTDWTPLARVDASKPVIAMTGHGSSVYCGLVSGEVSFLDVNTRQEDGPRLVIKANPYADNAPPAFITEHAFTTEQQQLTARSQTSVGPSNGHKPTRSRTAENGTCRLQSLTYDPQSAKLFAAVVWHGGGAVLMIHPHKDRRCLLRSFPFADGVGKGPRTLHYHDDKLYIGGLDMVLQTFNTKAQPVPQVDATEAFLPGSMEFQDKQGNIFTLHHGGRQLVLVAPRPHLYTVMGLTHHALQTTTRASLKSALGSGNISRFRMEQIVTWVRNNYPQHIWKFIGLPWMDADDLITLLADHVEWADTIWQSLLALPMLPPDISDILSNLPEVILEAMDSEYYLAFLFRNDTPSLLLTHPTFNDLEEFACKHICYARHTYQAIYHSVLAARAKGLPDFNAIDCSPDTAFFKAAVNESSIVAATAAHWHEVVEQLLKEGIGGGSSEQQKKIALAAAVQQWKAGGMKLQEAKLSKKYQHMQQHNSYHLTEHDCAKTITTLLEYGASFTVKEAKEFPNMGIPFTFQSSVSGDNLLHILVRSSSASTLKYILRGATPKVASDDDVVEITYTNPVHSAISDPLAAGSQECLQLAAQRNKNGQLPRDLTDDESIHCALRAAERSLGFLSKHIDLVFSLELKREVGKLNCCPCFGTSESKVDLQEQWARMVSQLEEHGLSVIRTEYNSGDVHLWISCSTPILTENDDYLTLHGTDVVRELKAKASMAAVKTNDQLTAALPTQAHIFGSSDRYKLSSTRQQIILDIIAENLGHNYIDKMIVDDYVAKVFPAHNDDELNTINEMKTWQFFVDLLGIFKNRPVIIQHNGDAPSTPTNTKDAFRQRLNKTDLNIRGTGMLRWEYLDKCTAYYGSKLTFYLAFISFYTGWLRYLLVFSIAWQILSMFDNETTERLTIWNLATVTLWGGLLVALWERKSSELSFMWGTRHFDMTELPSAKFITKHKRKGTKFFWNPLTGEEEPARPSWMFYLKSVLSWTITTVLLLAAVFLMIAVLRLKENDSVQEDFVLKQLVTAGSSTLIVITNKVYGLISVSLTNFEDHRTLTAEEDSLIVKNFIFQYFNTFISLVYVLVTQRDTSELRLQLMTQLVIQAAVAFGMEKVLSWLLIKWSMKGVDDSDFKIAKVEEVPLDASRLSQEDIDDHASLLKQCYLPQISSFYQDYNYLAIQYALATHFAVVLPGAPILAFVLNLFELWTDRYKFRTLSQRPVAYQAKSIGVWSTIFSILTFIGLPTNTLSVVLLLDEWEYYIPGVELGDTDYKEAFFICGITACGIFLLWIMTKLLIPPTAKWVREQELLERLNLKQALGKAKRDKRKQHHTALKHAASSVDERSLTTASSCAVYKRTPNRNPKRPKPTAGGTNNTWQERTGGSDGGSGATPTHRLEQEQEQELLAQPIVGIPPVIVRLWDASSSYTMTDTEITSINDNDPRSGNNNIPSPHKSSDSANKALPPADSGGSNNTTTTPIGDDSGTQQQQQSAEVGGILQQQGVTGLPVTEEGTAPPPIVEPQQQKTSSAPPHQTGKQAVPEEQGSTADGGSNPLRKEFSGTVGIVNAPSPTSAIPSTTAISVNLAYSQSPRQPQHLQMDKMVLANPGPDFTPPFTYQNVYPPSAWPTWSQQAPNIYPQPHQVPPSHVPVVRHPIDSTQVVTV